MDLTNPTSTGPALELEVDDCPWCFRPVTTPMVSMRGGRWWHVGCVAAARSLAADERALHVERGLRDEHRLVPLH